MARGDFQRVFRQADKFNAVNIIEQIKSLSHTADPAAIGTANPRPEPTPDTGLMIVRRVSTHYRGGLIIL